MSDPIQSFLAPHLVNLRRVRADLINGAAATADRIGLNPAHIRGELERLLPQVPHDFTVPTAPGVVPLGEKILGSAAAHRGKPYVWAGDGVDTFDCSALTQRAHRDNGITIGRTTFDQIKQGREIRWGEQQIGDLIFSRFSARGPEHVSIWAGNGKVFEAGDPLNYYTWGQRGTVRVRRMW